MAISSRAKKLRSAPSAIVQGAMRCYTDLFTPANTGGYLNFGVAENHLVNDLLMPKLRAAQPLEKEHIQYGPLHGHEDVRVSICNFLEKYIGTGELNPEKLIIQTGVSAICESLTYSLFEEGDLIMIPAPYYTGFDHDFTKRFGAEFLKVHLSEVNGFRHTIESFMMSYRNCSQKEKVKAVLITHPQNPTGEIIDEQFQKDIIDFCLKHDLHLISDEIYALSSHGDHIKHSSLYRRATATGVRSHLMYGMAKDFCLAGFKVGFYYSEDSELSETMQAVSYFHPVSTQTQVFVRDLLSDHHFLGKYISTNQCRLKAAKEKVLNAIPHFKKIPSDAGLFFLADFTDRINNFAEEKAFFNELLDKHKVFITAGADLGLEKPGYFRVCFTKPDADITEFITRMQAIIKDSSQPLI